MKEPPVISLYAMKSLTDVDRETPPQSDDLRRIIIRNCINTLDKPESAWFFPNKLFTICTVNAKNYELAPMLATFFQKERVTYCFIKILLI